MTPARGVGRSRFGIDIIRLRHKAVALFLAIWDSRLPPPPARAGEREGSCGEFLPWIWPPPLPAPASPGGYRRWHGYRSLVLKLSIRLRHLSAGQWRTGVGGDRIAPCVAADESTAAHRGTGVHERTGNLLERLALGQRHQQCGTIEAAVRHHHRLREARQRLRRSRA